MIAAVACLDVLLVLERLTRNKQEICQGRLPVLLEAQAEGPCPTKGKDFPDYSEPR